VARMGDKRGSCRVFVGRPEGKSPLGKPRRKWNYNIKIDLQKLGWGMDSIDLA